MGEVGNGVAVHLQIDGDGRAAKLGMGGCAGVGRRQPAKTGDVAGQLQDAAVVDVVEHGALSPADRPKDCEFDCFRPYCDYIWLGRPPRKGFCAGLVRVLPAGGAMQIGNAASNGLMLNEGMGASDAATR